MSQSAGQPGVVVLMGVSGTGKTTVGAEAASRLGWRFYDGDDFHPPANVEKMAAGRPLDDADREPWLRRLRAVIDEHLAEGRGAVVACSALKKSYRSILGVDRPGVGLVHLAGERETIADRMRERAGHYFSVELLDSQFAALEPPERAVRIEIAQPVEAIVKQVMRVARSLTGGSEIDDETTGAGDDAIHRVIVAGFGPVGRGVADALDRDGVRITIIDLNEQTLSRQARLGRQTLLGDAREESVLRAAGIETADALIVAVPDEEVAIAVCREAHAIRPEVFIAVRTNFLSKGMIASEAGADAVVVEEVATAEAMKRIVCERFVADGGAGG